MARILVFMFAAVMLSGCFETTPREVAQGEFDPGKVSYFRDARTDQCFAVVAYDRMDTNGRSASGMSHASVPCTEKVLRMVRP